MEFDSYASDNVAISFGKDELTDPDDDLRTRMTIVDFVGCAIAVKDEYKPEYRYVSGFGGNHTINVPVTDDKTYEYMLFAAWSEGQVYNTPETFKEYVLKSVREYNNPVKVEVGGVDKKDGFAVKNLGKWHEFYLTNAIFPVAFMSPAISRVRYTPAATDRPVSSVPSQTMV